MQVGIKTCLMVVIDFAAIERPPAFLSLLFFFSLHKPEETMVDPQRIWAQAHTKHASPPGLKPSGLRRAQALSCQRRSKV